MLRLGWLHGVVFWLASIPWIAPTLEVYGRLPVWLSWVLLLVLALYLGLFHGLFASLGGVLWRRLPWPLLLAVLPSLWVALELVRGWFLSGFPWNLAAYAWVEVPGALPLSSWIGPYGVGWLLVAANTSIALAVGRGKWEAATVGILTPLLLLALAGRFARIPAERPGPPREVRLLQPNVPNLLDPTSEQIMLHYGRVIEMSMAACETPGTLVVWPESAGWPLSYPTDPLLAADVQRLLETGCPLLLNSTVRTEDGLYNSAFLLRPDRPDQRYDKRHLVPFGEYVLFADLLPFMESLARGAGDYVAAADLVLLDWREERLGVAICFEITFPHEVAETVREGATTLVTITNDAWYGDSSAPWQHFRAVRFRAAESGRPVLRAAITGVSAVVLPDGEVPASLGVFERGVIASELRGRRGLTLYTRFPWAVPAASWIVVGVAALCYIRRWRTGS